MTTSEGVLGELKAIEAKRFRTLSDVFERLRRESAAEVERILAKLPDHPMRSAVTAFGMIEFGRLETAYTRALAWLLSPNAAHGFDEDILQSVLRCCLKDVPYEHFALEDIASEYRVTPNDRIDIFISGSYIKNSEVRPISLTIEAKIDQQKRDDQLYRYKTSIEMNPLFAPRDNFFVFVSPDRLETIPRPWRQVSFSEIAQAIWAAASIRKDAQGFHFARHYVAGILGDILKWPIPIDEHTSHPVSVYSYLKHEYGSV